eukprot:TRINITY_DN3981_c1_g1_i1.p1 TRINITY_DN3981_c1_g1~~TRINITY_DN3981_c1_g1_i1.p1  ORF type:complete len:784 (+),score=118.58 TRINITY_DN3981_c1_g1_i1:38-2353(+)
MSSEDNKIAEDDPRAKQLRISIVNRDFKTIKKIVPDRVSATTIVGWDNEHSIEIVCDKLVEDRDELEPSEKEAENDEYYEILDYLLATKTLDPSKLSLFHTCRKLTLKSSSTVCKIMSKLAHAGADMNEVCNTGHTVLMYAFTQPGFKPVVEFVDEFLKCCDEVQTKPNLETKSANNLGLMQTLFTLTSPKYWEDVVHVLEKFETYRPGISLGRDAWGSSTLTTAVQFGMPKEVLTFLIEKGCDPSEKTQYGTTAIDAALSRIAYLEGVTPTQCTGDDVRRAAVIMQQYHICSIEGIVCYPPTSLVGSWYPLPDGHCRNTFRVRFRASREDVAVKICEVRPSRTLGKEFFYYSDLCREIYFLDSCRSRYIINFLGITRFEQPESLGLVTELYSRSLFDVLSHPQSNSNPHPDMLVVAKHIGSALLYLHVNKKVHADVAARNVVVTSTGVKLSGFGNAAAEGSILPNMAILWAPPELLEAPAIYRTAKPSLDIWSFGVLLFELLSQCQLPYYSPSEGRTTLVDIRKYIVSGGRLQRPVQCTEDQWKLVTQCFQPEDSRPTAYEVLQSVSDYCKEHEVVDSGRDDNATSTSADRTSKPYTPYGGYGCEYGYQSNGTDIENTELVYQYGNQQAPLPPYEGMPYDSVSTSSFNLPDGSSSADMACYPYDGESEEAQGVVKKTIKPFCPPPEQPVPKPVGKHVVRPFVINNSVENGGGGKKMRVRPFAANLSNKPSPPSNVVYEYEGAPQLSHESGAGWLRISEEDSVDLAAYCYT